MGKWTEIAQQTYKTIQARKRRKAKRTAQDVIYFKRELVTKAIRRKLS